MKTKKDMLGDLDSHLEKVRAAMDRHEGNGFTAAGVADLNNGVMWLHGAMQELKGIVTAEPVHKWGPGTCGECGRLPCSEGCPTAKDGNWVASSINGDKGLMDHLGHHLNVQAEDDGVPYVYCEDCQEIVMNKEPVNPYVERAEKLELLGKLCTELGFDVVQVHGQKVGTVWEAEKTTHILHEGRALCGFLMGTVPGEWPEGQKWVGLADAGDANMPGYIWCAGCDAVKTQAHDLSPTLNKTVDVLMDTLSNELCNQSEWEFEGWEIESTSKVHNGLWLDLVKKDDDGTVINHKGLTLRAIDLNPGAAATEEELAMAYRDHGAQPPPSKDEVVEAERTLNRWSSSEPELQHLQGKPVLHWPETEKSRAVLDMDFAAHELRVMAMVLEGSAPDPEWVEVLREISDKLFKLAPAVTDMDQGHTDTLNSVVTFLYKVELAFAGKRDEKCRHRSPRPCDGEGVCRGWDVFDGGRGCLEIQRCDTCERFDSDEAAALHLQQCYDEPVEKEVVEGPLGVKCPECNQLPGDRCRNRGSKPPYVVYTKEPHKARMALWKGQS